MSIYWPPQVFDDPRVMPEFRAGLRSLAQQGGYWHEAERFRQMNELAGNHRGTTVDHVTMTDESVGRLVEGPTGYAGDDLGRAVEAAHIRTENTMLWNREAVEKAQLIHVSSDLCDVLFSAHDSVPDDTVLDESLPPTPFGLVVFQTPFVGIDSGTEFAEVRVDALMWGPVRLPSRTDWQLSVDGVHNGFAIAAFRWMDPNRHTDPAAVRLKAEVAKANAEGTMSSRANWVPLGRSDWLLGDELSVPTHDGIDPAGNVHESMCEDRRLVAALWSLVRQKRVVERTIVEPTRHARKRLDRAGDRAPRSVEVVHLRRPEYLPRNDDETATESRYRVRWTVRPHWRNQAWGPNRSRRRLILVPPHVKGPADAPMTHVERVWSVDS